MTRMSVIVVAYESAATLPGVLAALERELGDGDEVIVVDNASADGSAAIARSAGATVLASATNDGFPAACNAGARASVGDVLVFLNPDAVPQPGWGAAIRAPREWAAWQGLVLTVDGSVNTAGNTVHFTGLAWAGEKPVRRGEVASCSGACMAVRREWFERVGGFAAGYFLYHEDVDLSLRLRLAGGRLGLEPDARVEHAYEFAKGATKWRLLERNRWATLVRIWPGRLLAALAPALLATELAIWLAALRGGWGREKAAATGAALRALPGWIAERRTVERTIGASEFAGWLTPELSSPYLGAVAGNRLIDGLLRAYWRAALRTL